MRKQASHLSIGAVVAVLSVSSALADDFGFVEQQRLTALGGDRFGWSVSVRSEFGVVGAPWNNHAGNMTGAVYVYQYDGNAWNQVQRVTASDAQTEDEFGISVSLSSTGNILAVGSPEDDDLGPASGATYVFRRDGSSWTEEKKIVPVDGGNGHRFGGAVAVLGEDAVVIGSQGDDHAGFSSGSAYVYRYDGTDWVREQKLISADARRDQVFGISVAVDGNAAVVGALWDDDQGTRSGALYVFRYDGVGWTEEQKLTRSDGGPNDLYGYSVAIRGDWIAATAEVLSTTYVYRFNGIEWEEQRILDIERRPSHNAVALIDNVLLVGSWQNNAVGVDSGIVWVYLFDQGEWIETQMLFPSDAMEGDGFGYSVALSDDGVAMIGSNNSIAYVFSESHLCSPGTVNAGSGRLNDVLFVNNSTGGNDHTLDVGIGEPITVSLNSPLNGPAVGKYALWVWNGGFAQIGSTLSVGGDTLGCLVNRHPLAGGGGQPIRCVRGEDVPNRACGQVREVPGPARFPWSLTRNEGLSQPRTLTVQGVIQDVGAANLRGFSVTNALIINAR